MTNLRNVKKFRNRGQVLILYALLMPVFVLMAGVGLDLGWYYLNVSRLQNAADAAALAGAKTLVQQSDFNNYLVVSLASNQLPTDFDDYEKAYSNTFDSTTIATGVLNNYKKIGEVTSSLEESRKVAEEYVRKNLSNDQEVSESSSWKTLSAIDNWSISTNEANKKVNGTIELKYKIVDGKNDVYGPRYFVVNLTEKIRHLFMPGWFDDMDAPVRAVVLLRPHYKGLIEPMEQLERTEVIDNWEYAKKYRGTVGAYAGKWNHYQAGIRSNSNYGIRYTSGNSNRTESVIVKTSRKTAGKNVIASADGSSGEATDANGGNWYSATEVDSINIDMRAEVKGKFSTDWDIGYDFGETGHSYQFMEGWSATDGSDKRILFNVEFDEPFPTRDTSRQADPLWVRIESDPIKNPYTGAGVANFNSVRQITLNFNSDNTIVEESGENAYYKYRPYVIFYDGPENIDYTTDENGVLKRHSQPVVINLNEDLNAIIYMPESPVIINGNNHALHGFVIAKCYLKSVTKEDMTGGKSITLYDGFNSPSTLDGDFTELTDGYGNTIYVKSDNLLTKESIDAAYPNATITNDENGNVIVKEKIEAPKYPIISFSKSLYTNCKTLDEYFTITANYINTTYTKEKYAQFSGLDESQVSMIKFPDETFEGKYHNFTAITIPVATADLLDSDPDPNVPTKDDKYVKVLVVDSTGENSESSGDSSEPQYVEKYIAKSKLPHMRIKRNANYPYVCLYDLKTGVDNNYNSVFATVKPTDDSITAPSNQNDNSAVAFLNGGKDTWAINRDLLTGMYDKEYTASKLEFSEKDGTKYFVRKSEIVNEPQVVAEYRKVTTVDEEGNEIVRYVKEGDKNYYMKVDNNKVTENGEEKVVNYIITDENGNILTKPVTAPELRVPSDSDSITENVALMGKTNLGTSALSDYWSTYTRDPKDPDEIPGDRGKEDLSNNQYIGRSEYRQFENYRIPMWERVYEKSTFNLNDNSYYSYFGIDDLWRSNYTYLNVDEINHLVNRKSSEKWKVDDMFFTTVRAEWID